MRSILVAPLGAHASVDRAFAAGADVVVLDFAAGLHDGLDRAALRRTARDVLQAARRDTHRPHLYVAMEGLDDPRFDADLAGVMGGKPDGIMLSRSNSGLDAQHLGAKLAVLEAEQGLADGSTRIIAEAGATARALFSLASYLGASPRLSGLAWNATSLAGELGCDRDRTNGTDAAPMQLTRHMTLFAARGAGVAAIDAACDTRDEAAFVHSCGAARRHGYDAKLTHEPDQVAVINATFGRA